MTRAVLGVILTAGAAWGQTFEVSSIKEQDYNAPGRGGGVKIAGTRVTAANTLRGLIVSAFDLRDSQVTGGPSWMSPPGPVFVITAKVDGQADMTAPKVARMMQKILTDRFRLKMHRETKDLAVYDLVIAKGGAKMKAAAADASGGVGTENDRLIDARTTMASLAIRLSTYSGRRVVDKTGLSGNYDVKLEWAGENQPGPTLFTALQEQMGLKLEPSTAATELLVIDSAEKP